MWKFFFKTVCNTNPAKTIVQKVTKQQSLGLMQYRLYRNSHDEMCRSGTVNTKEPRRRLIFPPTVCVLDLSPKLSIQQTSRSAQQAMVGVCSPEETMEKQVSWAHEDPQQAEWEQYLVCFCGGRCEPWETAQITGTLLSHPILQVFTECFLTATNEGACPC